MQEVYWAACEAGAGGTRLVGVEAVAAPAAVRLPAAWGDDPGAWGVGTGFEAYPAALAPLAERLARRVALEGDAEAIARIAGRAGTDCAVDPELAAPVYLRDDVAQASAGTGDRSPR
ncbi:MAG: hypothetical protein U1F30_02080 [Steroidobacteraceae bacterium]